MINLEISKFIDYVLHGVEQKLWVKEISAIDQEVKCCVRYFL